MAKNWRLQGNNIGLPRVGALGTLTSVGALIVAANPLRVWVQIQSSSSNTDYVDLVISRGVDSNSGAIVDDGRVRLRPGEGFLWDKTNPWDGDIHGGTAPGSSCTIFGTEMVWTQ
tara:strand:- start:244 stop:588 length:345 start_codon:yes stop_codon:yes gene_type:complete